MTPIGGSKMPKKLKGGSMKPYESIYGTDHFTLISESMMNSKAWQALPIKARYLYFEMKRSCAGDKIKAHALVFTYEYAQQFMNQATFQRSLNHLIEKGFIMLESSGFRKHQPNLYGFSERWKQWGNKYNPNDNPVVKSSIEALKQSEKQADDADD